MDQLSIVPQLIANSLISGSLYALVSLGLCLTYGLLKILNFSHGQVLTVGAYAFYAICIEYFVGNFESGVLIATATGCLLVLIILSYLTLQFFVFPFLAYSPMLSFVATLALGTILESVIAMVFGVNVKSLTAGHETSSIPIFSALLTWYQIIIIVSTAIILSAIAVIVHLTPLGRKIRAISQHSKAAQSLGVSSRAVILLVVGVGTVVAGYAGIMAGLTTNAQPTMGNAYTIKAFAAMVLGGLGNVWGTMIGSYFLGFIENFSLGLEFGGYSLPSGYKDAFAFVIILAVLLYRPQGIFSFRRRRV